MGVQGTVEATAKNGTGFKVGEVWYNIIPGEAFPKKGDGVAFTLGVGSDGKQYVQGLQITPGAPQQKSWGGGGGRKQRTPHDIYGPIIGHNLLVAATVLPEGSSVQEVIDYCKQLTLASEKLVDEYVARKAQSTAQPVIVQPTAPATPPVMVSQSADGANQPAPFNDDIPW